MIYQHDKKINFYDLDAEGNMKLTALLKYINDASWYSAEAIGVGMRDTLKYDMVFLMQRFGIKIFNIPKMDETIKIRTWPGQSTRSAFKRQGVICSAGDEVIIEWESLWVLIDINERRIKRPNQLPIEFPTYGKQGVEIAAKKIKIPTTTKLASYHHIVQYSELDVNGHMNNAIYADLVTNILAKIEKHSMNSHKEVQFNYVNEAKLYDEILVECHCSVDTIYITGICDEAVVFTAEIL